MAIGWLQRTLVEAEVDNCFGPSIGLRLKPPSDQGVRLRTTAERYLTCLFASWSPPPVPRQSHAPISFTAALAHRHRARSLAEQGCAVLKRSRIASELRTAILRVVRPGTALPSEPALATLFEASRVTIRSALQTLEVEGLVERRRGAVTFARPHAMDLLLGRLEDAGGADRPVAARLLKVEPQTAGLAERLAMKGYTGADVVEIRVLHTAGGAPAILDVSTIPAAILPLHAARAVGREGLYPILSRLGIEVADVRDVADAVPLTEADAAVLKLTPGAPVLRIHRIAHDAAGRVVKMRIRVVRSDLFRIAVSSRGRGEP